MSPRTRSGHRYLLDSRSSSLNNFMSSGRIERERARAKISTKNQDLNQHQNQVQNLTAVEVDACAFVDDTP